MDREIGKTIDNELVNNGIHVSIAVSVARQLVDEVGFKTK